MKKALRFFALLLSLLLILCGCAPTDTPSDTTPESTPDSVSDTASDTPSDTAPESTPDTSSDTVPDTPSDTAPDTTPDTTPDTAPVSKQDSIPFADDQLYAVAYLGYLQIDDLDYYVSRYLDSDELPVHYVSSGDYYLVIPRYAGMSLSLYVNDIETSQGTLFYEDPACEPFIIQCNVSDIFADVTIRLAYNGETVEFSPFISLENGDLIFGERGLDITKSVADGAVAP